MTSFTFEKILVTVWRINSGGREHGKTGGR